LHHLLDEPSDYVVADTTAGTDNVATTLSFAYDMNVFVVEPTNNSINVYKDFTAITPHLAERTFVVGNKVESVEDESFIRDQVELQRYLGSIPRSHYLKLFDQGQSEALDSFYAEQEPTFDQILKCLGNFSRDWTEYLKLLRETHAKACLAWANSMYESDLLSGLDPSFEYGKVAKLAELQAIRV
jgi:CO dehydrogenase maturation factor